MIIMDIIWKSILIKLKLTNHDTDQIHLQPNLEFNINTHDSHEWRVRNRMQDFHRKYKILEKYHQNILKTNQNIWDIISIYINDHKYYIHRYDKKINLYIESSEQEQIINILNKYNISYEILNNYIYFPDIIDDQYIVLSCIFKYLPNYDIVYNYKKINIDYIVPVSWYNNINRPSIFMINIEFFINQNINLSLDLIKSEEVIEQIDLLIEYSNTHSIIFNTGVKTIAKYKYHDTSLSNINSTSESDSVSDYESDYESDSDSNSNSDRDSNNLDINIFKKINYYLAQIIISDQIEEVKQLKNKTRSLLKCLFFADDYEDAEKLRKNIFMEKIMGLKMGEIVDYDIKLNLDTIINLGNEIKNLNKLLNK